MTIKSAAISELQPRQGEAAADVGQVLVLLVDDQSIVHEAMRRMLEDEPNLVLRCCPEATQALRMARELKPTVILQDLVMPDLDGFTLLKFYRADPSTTNVPVIVLSTKENPADKSRAFSSGASDYLVKLPDKIELVARVRAHSRVYLLQQQRDEAFRKLELLKHELEERNVELARLSAVDGLTGIANRRCFDDSLEREWRRAVREPNELSLIMIDIDFFKRYNDAYGHPAGDECLRRVAGALAGVTRRPADLVARYGGEEFAVLLPSCPSDGAVLVAGLASECVGALQIEHCASEVDPHVTLSLGIASMRPQPSSKPAELVMLADQALYAAKHGGRNRFSIAR